VGRVCPWWLGYLLASPVRKLAHHPDKILSPYIARDMVAVDIGCGMGYFSIPMAALVGPKGKVVCVDLQVRMLASLQKRARKNGVLERIEISQAGTHSLNLQARSGTADFVLAFAVVHEIPDHDRLFSEIAAVLKRGGKLLVSEPKGHVTEPMFTATRSMAQAHGLDISATPKIWGSHSILFKKT
jgi:ubiquinone/menaquinone biosynthesis C-methylase UbiE